MNYSIPTLLEPVLVHKNCIKVGVNIKSDFWKLQRDYQLGLDQIMIGDNSIVDLGVMANKMLGKSLTLTKHILIVVVQESRADGVWVGCLSCFCTNPLRKKNKPAIGQNSHCPSIRRGMRPSMPSRRFNSTMKLRRMPFLSDFEFIFINAKKSLIILYTSFTKFIHIRYNNS